MSVDARQAGKTNIMKTIAWLKSTYDLPLARILAFSSLMVVSAGIGQGATSACVSSGLTQTIDSIDNAAPNGCGAINLSFENFILTGAAATTSSFVDPTVATMAVNASGTTPTATTTFTVLPTTGGDWDANSSNSDLRMTLDFICRSSYRRNV